MAAPAPQPFVMHGARDAMARGLAHIEEQVKGIEQAVVENPGLAFDLAKTLIESTCRAVLGERSVAYAAADDLPKLFRSATQNLPSSGDRERRCRGAQEPATDSRRPQYRDPRHLRTAKPVRLRLARLGRTAPGNGSRSGAAGRRGRRRHRGLPPPRPSPGPHPAAPARARLRGQRRLQRPRRRSLWADPRLRGRVPRQRSSVPDGARDLPHLPRRVRRRRRRCCGPSRRGGPA